MSTKKIQPADPKAVAPEAKQTEDDKNTERKTAASRFSGRKSGRKANQIRGS